MRDIVFGKQAVGIYHEIDNVLEILHFKIVQYFGVSFDFMQQLVVLSAPSCKSSYDSQYPLTFHSYGFRGLQYLFGFFGMSFFDDW
jgi:hypothetical protein